MHAALTAGTVAALLATAPTTAQTAPARDLAGWTVAVSEDHRGCFATRTYDTSGETTLMLGIDIDGSHRLSVLNRDWSIGPGERWRLDFRLTKGGYDRQLVVGLASDGKKGFVTQFDAKFPTHLATSNAIHIYRGAVPVAKLGLAGSAAAVADVRRCVAGLRDRPARGAERDDGIPRDPFAPDRPFR